MQKIFNWTNKIYEIEETIGSFLAGFLGLITVRVFIEQFLAISQGVTVYELLLEIIHNALFFSILFLLIWIFLSSLFRINPSKMTSLFLWASFFVILPPIMDMVRTSGEVYWSFYLLSSLADLKLQILSIFGNLPSGIVYFGTRITFVLAIIAITFLVYAKTKNIWKTMFAPVVVYLAMFLLGAFPTIFFMTYSFFSQGLSISEIQGFNIAQFFIGDSKTLGIESIGVKYLFVYKLNYLYFPILIFLLTILGWKSNKKKLFAILRNLRLPQLFYHSGLFFTGIAFGIFRHPENFSINIFSVAIILVLLLGVWLSWKTSVVVNDLYDQKIDLISNSFRPLPEKIFNISEYKSFGVLCLVLALGASLIAGFKFFFVLLAYQIIAWIYSAPPFRLKRFPLVATFLSAIASLLIFFLGYILLSPNQLVHDIPFRLILLLVMTYTVSIPLKDFKDIAGDRADNVKTLPVIFGETKARIIVASCVFLSFVVSVFLLNERRLFWWAILFGALSYTLIVRKKTTPRSLPWLMMGIVFIYGCVLVWVVMKS